jgi:molecular chaperone IbpA
MATALSLTPLLRQTVGFDRLNDLFENLNGDNEFKQAFPPYDIVKTGENTYQIIMALAGYSENDLGITLEKDTLTITGKSENSTNDNTIYLHRGIAKRAFDRTFRLADHMKVLGATMKNGLLTINLEREIPEEKKPQIIAINSQD